MGKQVSAYALTPPLDGLFPLTTLGRIKAVPGIFQAMLAWRFWFLSWAWMAGKRRIILCLQLAPYTPPIPARKPVAQNSANFLMRPCLF